MRFCYCSTWRELLRDNMALQVSTGLNKPVRIRPKIQELLLVSAGRDSGWFILVTYRQACGSVMQPLFFTMGSNEDWICSGYATNLDINIIISYQYLCFNLYYVARCYPLWMHKIAANKWGRYMSNRNLKSMYISGRPYDNTFHNTATRFDDAFITLYHQC